MKTLIIGATSAIAKACARRFAAAGDELYLCARNREALEAIAQDLRVRGASKVTVAEFDASDPVEHERLVERAVAELGGRWIVC